MGPEGPNILSESSSAQRQYSCEREKQGQPCSTTTRSATAR